MSSAREIYPLGDMFAHIKEMGMNIAIVGKESDINNFVSKMDDFYPGFNFDTSILSEDELKSLNGTIELLKVPKLSEITLKFTSEDDLKDYIKDEDYTRHDRIYLAITLNSFSENNYDYLLRYNMSDDSPNFQNQMKYI